MELSRESQAFYRFGISRDTLKPHNYFPPLSFKAVLKFRPLDVRSISSSHFFLFPDTHITPFFNQTDIRVSMLSFIHKTYGK